ncbi:MAG: hypothetical protein HQK58_10405 [Deltaproteobacteria bacterium]|nr:hypothetical protein [Deltaproteobacteria bacterium]
MAMKKSSLSLRFQVVAGMTLLMLAAIFFINVIILRLAEDDILRQKAGQISATISTINQSLFIMTGPGQPARVDQNQVQIFIQNALTNTSLNPLVIYGPDLKPLSPPTALEGNADFDFKDLETAVNLRAPMFKTAPTATWIINWNYQNTRLVVSAPLFAGHRLIGACQGSIKLKDFQAVLMKGQRMVWLFILIYCLIFILFGNYLLTKQLVNPMQRMGRLVDSYRDVDEPFNLAEDWEINEVGRLYLSIKKMIARLEENKVQLKHQIEALETANREILKTRNKMIISEKMASVGRLAAGIAHEIGNPLGAVLGYLEILGKDALSNEEGQDIINRIGPELERINRIVRQLLNFSRPPQGHQADVRVDAILQEATDLFRFQEIKSGIAIALNLHGSLPLLRTDPDLFKQVIINLMVNACDAMVQGGVITLETDVTTTDGSDSSSPQEVIIRVSDTGPGIPAEEIGLIFDPFYTTKPPGHGTGLGLSTTLGIIESMGGRVSVHNAASGGAVFTLTIPVNN